MTMTMLDVEHMLHQLCTKGQTGARLREAAIAHRLERDVWELIEIAYHIGLTEGREGKDDGGD